MLGFALHFRHESTWVIGEDCYLEDLFVVDSARGKGVGRALIGDLRHLAETQGCARLYWTADADNARARALYRASRHRRHRGHYEQEREHDAVDDVARAPDAAPATATARKTVSVRAPRIGRDLPPAAARYALIPWSDL